MEHIQRKVKVRIENLDYWFYESYIRGGSGYSFGIYKTSKFIQRRNNVYHVGFNYDIFVIIGKKKNYLLRRIIDDSSDYSLHFQKPEIYDKFVLRFEDEVSAFVPLINLYKFRLMLYDTPLVEFSTYLSHNVEFVKNEMSLANKLIRKEKLNRIASI